MDHDLDQGLDHGTDLSTDHGFNEDLSEVDIMVQVFLLEEFLVKCIVGHNIIVTKTKVCGFKPW